jgi:hypothetical protein
MNTSMELTNGKWLLLNGSRRIILTLLRVIGWLAETDPVRVVSLTVLICTRHDRLNVYQA